MCLSVSVSPPLKLSLATPVVTPFTWTVKVNTAGLIERTSGRASKLNHSKDPFLYPFLLLQSILVETWLGGAGRTATLKGIIWKDWFRKQGEVHMETAEAGATRLRRPKEELLLKPLTFAFVLSKIQMFASNCFMVMLTCFSFFEFTNYHSF